MYDHNKVYDGWLNDEAMLPQVTLGWVLLYFDSS